MNRTLLIKNLAGAAFCWAVLCLSVNWGSFCFVQKALKIHVRGHFRPSLIRWSFNIDSPNFEWKERVLVDSGTLNVKTVTPWSALWGVIRVQISSQNAVIKLKGDWSHMQGADKLALHNLFVDLVLDSKGVHEIHQVIAESPSFNFRIHENQTGGST